MNAPADIRLYNTATRKKEIFEPIRNGKVSLYVCGPTVYHYAHIGNLRSYVTWDVLRRFLEEQKYRVTHVMNITDVGHLQQDADTTVDKMEEAAREEKKTPSEIADYYTLAFFSDMQKLDLEKPSTVCRATDHIPEMIKLIQKLEKKGFTYLTKNAVYFDVQRFKKYGKFSGISLDNLKGVREGVNRDAEKKHPGDFRLWQLNQPEHVQQWDSPWGKGYPGWHIECSAMSMKYLGETIDIHTGGMDNIFPHHQNEIAQSEAATGKPFVHYWLHVTFNLVNGKKMSKSLHNIFTLTDVEEKGFSALDYRYLLLTAHYRTELNFTWDSLESARKTRENWNAFIHRLQTYNEPKTNAVRPLVKHLPSAVKSWISSTQEEIDKAFGDDINTPLVLAALSNFMRDVNKAIDQEKLTKDNARDVLQFLQKTNRVLRVFDFSQEETSVPATIIALAQKREKVRAEKDWKTSDVLREKIAHEGFDILDTKNGYEIRPRK